MSLIERARMAYKAEAESYKNIGVPIGFVPMGEGALVLFHRGDYRRLYPHQETAETGRLATPFGGSRRWCASAFQMRERAGVAVLYFAIEPEPGVRVVASYAPDGQLTNAVEFAWSGWDPAFRSFLCTAKGTFVFPHDREVTSGILSHPPSEVPLLDLYDGNGRLLRSFGTAQSHADINIASMLNHGYLTTTSREEWLFAFSYPYRLLKFSVDGDLLWDRTFESSSPAPPPSYQVLSPQEVALLDERAGGPESVRKAVGRVGVEWLGSRLINDVSVGPRWIAVLTPRRETDHGSRIDRLTLDGEHIDSHTLDQPASFIRVDAAENIWVLHEREGVVVRYRLADN